MFHRSYFGTAVVSASVGALVIGALVAGPVEAATGTVIVKDDFSRTVSSGLGSATTGGAYTVPEPKNVSVNGSQAVLGLSASVSRSALVGPSDAANVDATNSFGISALPSAGSVYLSQMLRTTSNGAHYGSRLRITPDKKISLGFRSVSSSSAATTIGSDITLPFTMAASTRIMLRSQVEGTALRAKAWAKGSTEPSSWQVTTTSAALPDAGRTGFWAYLGGGTNSMNVTVDDLSVSSLTPANVLPTAAFTESVTDLAVAFDASGSSDSDGTIATYAWDFGDGTTGSGKTPAKSYAAAGTYAVKLTVTDNRGGSATVTRQVTAIAANVLPTAAFTESVTDLAVAFDASGSSDSDGTIATYAWDFGDGTTGSGKTPAKSYAAAGTYAVKLTVTDNRGGSASTTHQVTATNPAPVKPSALNTGVPVGTGLTVYNGDLTITTPGTVIDSLDVRGYVSVKAANVTIKRSIIRGGPAATVNRAVLAITAAGASNFLIEDVTIAPANPTPYINGINVNQSGTIRRANVSGTVDGIMIYGSGVTVEQSYLHDFVHYLNDPNWGGGPSHDDSIQVQAGTGIKILGNTLTGAFNSAVMVTQDAGTTKDLWINNNWLDYGGCSINYGSNGAYKTGMQANNNRFGRAQRVSGCAIIHNAAMSDLVPVGNVWDDNGQPAGIKKGA